jgi:hypothetical protein
VNAYLELLVPRPGAPFFGHESVADPALFGRLVSDPDLPLENIDSLLLLCDQVHFKAGKIALLKRKQRNTDLASLFVMEDDAEGLADWVLGEAPELPGDDWMLILRYFARKDPNASPAKESYSRDAGFLRELVSKARADRSLFAVVQELSVINGELPFEVIEHDLNTELDRIVKSLNAEGERHRALTAELAKLEADIETLESADIEFKPLQCDCPDCPNPRRLQLPYVGFFCGHKVHQTCCRKDEDDQLRCPICAHVASPKYSLPPERLMSLEFNSDSLDLLDSIVASINNGYFSQPDP